MRKHSIITAAAALLAIPGAYAQYFGTPFYTEGFESAADLAKWTIDTEIAPTLEGTQLWNIQSSGFDDIDATSSNSVAIDIADGEKINTSLVSPVIDATGKSGLFAGIFGKDAFSNNYNWHGLRVKFQIKEEGTDTWETLYESPNNCLSTDTWSWYETRSQLAAKYDGKKFRVRINISSVYDSGVDGSMSLMFDGVYVSENYGKEAAVTAVTPFENTITTTPSTVTLTVLNNGKEPISNFKVAYSINDGADVEQTVTETLQPGAEKVVTFTQKAEFTEYGMEYNLTGKVMLDGDQVSDNDAITVKFANILTSLPYSYTPSGRNDTGYWDNPNVENTSRNWYVGLDRNTNEYVWTSQGYGNIANEVQLFTRPAMLTAGQSVSATFTAWGLGTGDEPGLEVYWVKYEDRYDLSKCTMIQALTLTAKPNKYKISFQAPAEGAYCLMFFSKPEINGMVPGIKNFEMTETAQYDGAIISIDAPKKLKDEYSTAETVTITVGNTGLQPMTGAKAKLSLNGTAVTTEDLPEVAGGNSTQFTFATKVDMSAGISRTLTAELIWAQDSDESNNSVSDTFVSDLASPPYSVDLYDNDFETHWEWTDNNSDGNTFAFEEVWSNHRITYNKDNATVPDTDDTLYSRTLRMEAGKTYKLSGRVSIWNNSDGSEATMNCSLDLYKVENDIRTFVKTLESKEHKSSDGKYLLGFDVPADGKYCIAFHLTKDSEFTSKVAIQDMAIEESGDVELALSSVKLPGTTVSGYNTLPYSIRIANNGLKEATGVTLKVAGATIGEKTTNLTFTEPLKAGSSVTMQIEEPLTMNITADEEVTFTLVADGDVVPANNVKTVKFSYKAPARVPVSVPVAENNGWLTFDNDRNGNAPGTDYYGGYSLSDGSKGDWLMSPTFEIEKDIPYHITWAGQMRGFSDSGKVYDLYLLNVADGSKSPCGTVVFDKETSPQGYSDVDMEAFAQVSADGVYALVFDYQSELGGYYPTLTLAGTLKVEVLNPVPDFKMMAVTEPAEAAVFTDSETVTATWKNAGETTFSGMNFTLEAGDNTYYKYVAGPIAPEAEGSVTFTDVDLYTPGDYDLKVTAQVFADKTLADNSVTRTLHSKYVYDVNMLSIDGPDNGPLTPHEHVKVSIKNEGHGDLTDVPVTMTITDDKGSAPVTVTETIAEVIKEGETLQYTFQAESDFSRDATYSVSISINLEGDINAENNTVTANILSTHEDMDAGVTAITGPTDRRNTGEDYLVIKVRNYSEVAIYRVPVKATVSRGDEVIGTVEGTIAEIAKGEEVEYTFTTPVNMERGGHYTVNATTSLPGDVDTTNDSCEGELYAWIKDCGVSRIISPEATTEAGRQTITVEIKNFGEVAMSDIPVFFKLGTNPQADKYEGTIEPGESVEFTFKSEYNFREGREYTISAYTAHPEDENPDNNECVQDIKPTSGIAGVYAGGAIRIESGVSAIDVTVEAGTGRLEVYTASGMAVAARDINSQNTRIELEPGVYVVSVADGMNTATTKVVVR